MKLNFEHKAVTSAINKKSKNNSKIRGRGEDSKESQQANSKMGDLKKKSKLLLKNKCAQRGIRRNATNKKQGTEFSAIYPN